MPSDIKDSEVLEFHILGPDGGGTGEDVNLNIMAGTNRFLTANLQSTRSAVGWCR